MDFEKILWKLDENFFIITVVVCAFTFGYITGDFGHWRDRCEFHSEVEAEACGCEYFDSDEFRPDLKNN